MFGGEELIQI